VELHTRDPRALAEAGEEADGDGHGRSIATSLARQGAAIVPAASIAGAAAPKSARESARIAATPVWEGSSDGTPQASSCKGTSEPETNRPRASSVNRSSALWPSVPAGESVWLVARYPRLYAIS